MPSHHEAIARRMVARLAPGPEPSSPSSPTDETTDESATGDSALFGGDDLVLSFAHVVTRVAGQVWDMYVGLDPNLVARRAKAVETGDMPVLQRETARLKQLLLRRLEAEVQTPPELPERGRARILDAAAEEAMIEAAGPSPSETCST